MKPPEVHIRELEKLGLDREALNVCGYTRAYGEKFLRYKKAAAMGRGDVFKKPCRGCGKKG
jgi:hypothetical protein